MKVQPVTASHRNYNKIKSAKDVKRQIFEEGTISESNYSIQDRMQWCLNKLTKCIYKHRMHKSLGPCLIHKKGELERDTDVWVDSYNETNSREVGLVIDKKREKRDLYPSKLRFKTRGKPFHDVVFVEAHEFETFDRRNQSGYIYKIEEKRFQDIGKLQNGGFVTFLEEYVMILKEYDALPFIGISSLNDLHFKNPQPLIEVQANKGAKTIKRDPEGKDRQYQKIDTIWRAELGPLGVDLEIPVKAVVVERFIAPDK